LKRTLRRFWRKYIVGTLRLDDALDKREVQWMGNSWFAVFDEGIMRRSDRIFNQIQRLHKLRNKWTIGGIIKRIKNVCN